MSTTSAAASLVDSSFNRDRRLLTITTQLGPDRLLLTALTGEETLSRIFRFDLDLLSSDQMIRPEAVVGTAVTVRIAVHQEQPRFIHGLVSGFRASALNIRGFRSYRAEVVPWLWFLSRTSDCRIFQQKSIPDIIKEVFEGLGFTDYEFTLMATPYPKLEFCVQYRETALSFVSRLMEQAGLFYFFRHDAQKHTLVISDSNVSFVRMEQSKFAFGGGHRGADIAGVMSAWEHRWEFRTGRWAQSDYNYETPQHNLLVSNTTVLGFAQATSFERFDYPGGYTETEAGKRLTRTLMEAEEARYHIVNGASETPALVPGAKFTMASHPVPGEEGLDYVLFSVRHDARDGSYMVGEQGSSYANSFDAIESKPPYRPYRVTPKPFVQGPQTATVVGPPGEKIHTDKQGRVKLQFHWDRLGKHDDQSSCWVRVSQAWAGSGWGGVNIPHVGHEVVVSFLEGDPDRPLVTGRVYNGDNQKAIGLPGDKTQSAMRDHSGNEIVMEGKSGGQDIRVHAVKDMHTTVDDKSDTVVHGVFTHDVTTATASYHVKGALTETYDATQATTVKSDITTTSTGGAIAISSDSKHIYINAATSIQLHVGSSMIWMDKGGQIKIQGVNVTVEGSSSVTIKGGIVHSEADSEHQTKGAIVLSEGSATNTVKGGMVMLNP